MKEILNHNKGFIFLEILIAIALISIVFITLLGIGFLSLNISSSIKIANQADSLAKEEFEALRAFRDGTTWASGLGTVSFGSSNPYYLVIDNSVNPPKWNIQSGTETVGIFTRSIVFDKVSRDPATQDIESVYSSANDDPDTIKATITISWLNKNSNVVAYFTNWQK